MKKKKGTKKQRYKKQTLNHFEIRLKNGKAEQTNRTTCFYKNPEQTIASLILTDRFSRLYFMGYILDNVTASLPFIMTPVTVNMEKQNAG